MKGELEPKKLVIDSSTPPLVRFISAGPSKPNDVAISAKFAAPFMLAISPTPAAIFSTPSPAKSMPFPASVIAAPVPISIAVNTAAPTATGPFANILNTVVSALNPRNTAPVASIAPTALSPAKILGPASRLKKPLNAPPSRSPVAAI